MTVSPNSGTSYSAGNFSPPAADIQYLVDKALQEDLTPFGDLTSTLIDPAKQVTAVFSAREAGVVAGCGCVDQTFQAVDSAIQVDWELADGDRAEAGQTIAVVAGAFTSMLSAARTALNFLSHLSGIASHAARWVEVAAGRVVVWDTRKTLPGYRSLQKAAVRAGGARNHRGNLSDWVLIKDNHLAGISVVEGVALARDRWPGRTVEVEVDTEQLLSQALEAQADIILLDNFTPEQLVKLVALVDAECGTDPKRPLLEASGGITLETLDSYAGTGVDLVSSGSLTNSAPVLDIGLDVVVE